MTTFLLDLWQDLRAKRLWPVAVALLAATVVVPLILFKPASSTPPSTGAGQASNTGKVPAVTLDASSIASSHLNIFKEKDPFNALRDAEITPGSDTAPATGDAGGSTAGSGSSGSGTSAASTAAGGTAGSTSPGTGGSTPPVGPDGKPIQPGVHYYTYTADVRFGPRGQIKDFKEIGLLDLLPSGDNPIVAFMGVKDGKTATFFIADPAFRAEGEGECAPDPDNCMFVSLTKDAGHDEETLSAQSGQVEYTLQLTDLHVHTVSKDEVAGDTTPSDSSTPAAKRKARKRISLLALPSVRVARR